MYQRARLRRRSTFSSQSFVESLEARKLLSAQIIGYLPDTNAATMVGTGGSGGQLDWTMITRLDYFAFKPEDFSGNPGSFVAPTSTTGGISTTSLDNAVTTAHSHSVAVDIVIGGYGQSDQFPTIAANSTSRANWVTNITSYASSHHLDGINLDWEPGSLNDPDVQSFGTLITALKTAAPSLKISVAVNPEMHITVGGSTEYVIPKSAIASLDNVNAMCYDLGFDSGLPDGAPYAQTINDVQNWLNYGVPAAKLMFGVPFYGDADYNYGVNATYQQLADAQTTFNANTDYSGYSGSNFYYNGQHTIDLKADWVLSHGLGGMVVWQIGQDHFTAGKYDAKSLLPVIAGDLFGSSNTANFATIDASGNIRTVGTSGDDTFTLSASGNTLTVQMGTTTKTFTLSSVNSITIDGSPGDDTLEYHGTIAKTILFNGGSGFDTLNVDSGAYTLAADAYLGNAALVVNVAAGASVAINSAQHLDGLNLLGAATVASGGTNLLSTNGLSIGSAGSLDLNDNDMIVDYASGGTSPLAAIGTYVKTAYAAAWGQSGLTSTAAKNNAKHNTGLAVVEASDYRAADSTTLFDGQAVDTSAVLVKYTFFGDTDLNGKVDANDYARIDAGYQNQHNSGFKDDWFNGDFNYDGKIDANDYGLIDGAYQTQGQVTLHPDVPAPAPALTVRGGGVSLGGSTVRK